jgi:NADH:ubiquinone oxidoreductase subunit 6 (subunit J)
MFIYDYYKNGHINVNEISNVIVWGVKIMNFNKLNKKKGVAGLELFTGIIVSIFMIGIILMVLQISGAKLMGSTTDAGAINAINQTMLSTATATDYFPLFIVLGAMLSIVLMLVIIVRAIRGSGMVGGGEGA